MGIGYLRNTSIMVEEKGGWSLEYFIITKHITLGWMKDEKNDLWNLILHDRKKDKYWRWITVSERDSLNGMICDLWNLIILCQIHDIEVKIENVVIIKKMEEHLARKVLGIKVKYEAGECFQTALNDYE